MAKYIQHQLFYPNPPELVWDYLTKPELIAQWLMPTDFKPVAGHEFKFTTKPHPEDQFDGIFYCKVLEVTPFTNLSYSWKFGSGDGILNDSVVNWTLREKDNGTELLLVHNGFTEEVCTLPMFASMNDGWGKLVKKMLLVINPVSDGTTAA
jgi:uncharacterized protein YndB with AHSA1/START domain